MSSGGLQLLQSVCPGVSLSILHGKLMATVSDLYIRFDPKTQVMTINLKPPGRVLYQLFGCWPDRFAR